MHPIALSLHAPSLPTIRPYLCRPGDASPMNVSLPAPCVWWWWWWWWCGGPCWSTSLTPSPEPPPPRPPTMSCACAWASLEKTILQKFVTYDFERQTAGATKVGTSEFATRIIGNM